MVRQKKKKKKLVTWTEVIRTIAGSLRWCLDPSPHIGHVKRQARDSEAVPFHLKLASTITTGKEIAIDPLFRLLSIDLLVEQRKPVPLARRILPIELEIMGGVDIFPIGQRSMSKFP